LIKQSSWLQRWQRRHHTTDAAESERLTQERLYGERRIVRRLAERRLLLPHEPGRRPEGVEGSAE